MHTLYSFIPAWYSDPGMVKPAAFWASYTDGMEFDDTVNQLRVFTAAGESTELLLLGCMPELRHFMHRQGLEGTKVWSAFDVIQGIRLRAAGMMSYLDFNWRDDIEWFHTPFLTAGFLGDKLLCKVYYGIGGHAVRLEWFDNDVLFRSDEIDDRGFISYRTFFEEGTAVRRVYYSDRVKPRIIENILTGEVGVCRDSAGCFDRKAYRCIGDLVEEVLQKHLAAERVKDGREIIAAYDERHNDLLCRAAENVKISFSFFSQRNKPENIVRGDPAVARAAAIVTDTERLADAVRAVCPEKADAIMDISPYDTRLSPGTSGNIRELKILFYIEDWHDAGWRGYLEKILAFMGSRPHTRLTVGLGKGCEGKVNETGVRQELAKLMETQGLDFAFENGDKTIVIENEDEPEIIERIFIRNCRSELDMMGLMADHRLIVDTDPNPALYLQIAGVSACVPLILTRPSRYVENGGNGLIVGSPQELPGALGYFLDGLANWNRAFVASLGKISQYTDGSLVKKWKRATGGADIIPQ